MPKKPIADAGEICPLHKKDVSDVCHTCPWYVLMRGTNPQSKAEIDAWGCAVGWIPLLQVQISKEVHQSAAATESFRNEYVKSMENPFQLLDGIARSAARQIGNG